MVWRRSKNEQRPKQDLGKESKIKVPPQWSRQFLLQENPPVDKWISSWILDPYDQDRKVLLWTLTFLFMKLNYSKKKKEEG
jgi:hypothetical protein